MRPGRLPECHTGVAVLLQRHSSECAGEGNALKAVRRIAPVVTVLRHVLPPFNTAWAGGPLTYGET